MTGYHDQLAHMDVVDREFARQHTPVRGGLDDVERNSIRGLEHEACDWHCDDCGNCSHEDVNLNVTRERASTYNAETDERLCEDCMEGTQ